MTVEKTAELTGHGNPIFTLELSQKPGILFTGGNDKGLVEWSLKDNTFIKVMFPVSASIYTIHGPANFPLLFTGLRNGDVLVFDFIKQQLLTPLKHHQKPIFDIKSVNHKQELLVASEDGTVSIWSLKTMELLHTVKVSDDTIRCISISPDEKQVAFGCRNNQIHIYDLEEYTLLKTLHGHTMSVFSLQYSLDGKYLVSGGRDAQVKIWDTASYSLLKNIPAHLFAVNSIVFHPSLPYFATGSMDKSVKIWGADDFKLYKIISREKGYAGHQLSINKLAWNGNQLLSVSDDKKIIVWDINFDS
ncbi:WD40 repeat domain-containing protein [Mucilaginibacter sp. OK098]|uniref:WD40 repeat domain-containing protein n=1 Tax=Mucilaginibacter sp. OK098 TaxID=1855297 RepID=UPI00091F691E|nr:WD40 repeat domain-containing protein [Mucilaginibacter sp. OK098]SHM12676.1 WD domain-containing protein, G-beta repeat-containing protein [Mucilaginibacter sp. OK098]